MNATSGARTVSGPRARTKPRSVVRTTPSFFCANVNPEAAADVGRNERMPFSRRRFRDEPSPDEFMSEIVVGHPVEIVHRYLPERRFLSHAPEFTAVLRRPRELSGFQFPAARRATGLTTDCEDTPARGREADRRARPRLIRFAGTSSHGADDTPAASNRPARRDHRPDAS